MGVVGGVGGRDALLGRSDVGLDRTGLKAGAARLRTYISTKAY